jgi:RNA recognition motif-containing protein
LRRQILPCSWAHRRRRIWYRLVLSYSVCVLQVNCSLSSQFSNTSSFPTKSSYQTYSTIRSFHVLPSNITRDKTPSPFPSREYHFYPRYPPTSKLRSIQRSIPRSGTHGNRPTSRNTYTATEWWPLSVFHLSGTLQNTYTPSISLGTERSSFFPGITCLESTSLRRRSPPRPETFQFVIECQLRPQGTCR